MATIGRLALALTKHTDLIAGLKRAHEWKYQLLVELVASHDDAPPIISDEAAVRVLVSLHTGLQPSEWDRLSIVERLPFIEKTSAMLGIPDPVTDPEVTDDGERVHLPAAIAKELTVSSPTVNKYARLAGATRPRQGQRDFRYTENERAAILSAVISKATDQDLVTKARKLLSK